jgi:calcineurin-like phosphoesterase family protein
MEDRRSLARTVGLGVVAFLATLILLTGIVLALGGRAPGPAVGTSASAGVGAAGSGSPTASASTAASPPLPSASAGASAPPAPTPSPAGDPVLVGAGDIASCDLDGDEATARLLDGIPGTVFTAGDNAYENGAAGEFTDCYGPSWGRHKARTRPAVGNHEYQTPDAAGYTGYFGAAATNTDGKTWYSYELGTWHVIVLDSNCAAAGGCDAGSEQGRWLAADLAGSTARCTVAIWHHPRFSSGEHGNDRAVAPFWQALYAAGADVVINGHDHDYERFAPQNPDGVGDPERGIREFVVGTGGAAIRRFTQDAANSQLRVALTHGVIKLTLHSGMYQWSWVPTSGLVSDSGSQLCH